MKPVIFTDLDGTLLHPVDYSFDAARQALALIKKKNIPLVFTSSKTRAEIEELRKKLSNRDPFISENGAAVFIPEGYFPFPTEGEGGKGGEGGEGKDGYIVKTLGSPVAEVREALAEIREATGANIRGFSDMSVEEVARLTGLGAHEAGLSKMREFDEPFIIEGDGSVIEEVLGGIERKGFNWTRGRFYHITGKHDKGGAVRILKDLFTTVYGRITTIGLGDNLNDVPLLEECDHPVFVRKADGGYEGARIKGLTRAEGVGPEGWNGAVLKLIERIGGLG